MSRRKTIEIDALEGELNSLLVNYNKEIVAGVKKETKKTMKEFVKNTKEDAPYRYGYYHDAITSKKVAESNDRLVMKWYVKGSDYRLTHLLENGHATRNGGRTKAFKFVSKNVEKIEKLYMARLKGVIRKSD